MALSTRAIPSLSYHQCLPLGNLQKLLSLIHQRADRNEKIKSKTRIKKIILMLGKTEGKKRSG